MYCKYCGTLNEEDSLFCKKCGESLIEKEENIKEEKENNKQNKVKTKKQKTKTKSKKEKKQKVKKEKKKVIKQYNDNSKEGMTLGQKLLMFILFILVLGLIGALSYIGYKYYNQKDLVKVPNVVGLTSEQAKLRLEESNLNMVEVIKETSVLDEDGIVIDQNKKVNKKVKKESKVKVYVGEYQVEIGEYVGIEAEKAKSKLDKMGIKYKITEELSDTYSDGVISYQSIKKGTKVKLNQVIELIVSKSNALKDKIVEENNEEETTE